MRAVLTKYLALLLSVASGGCASEASNTCQMAHVSDLPLSYKDLLTTTAFLNDQPTTVMLDTGAGVTLITKTAADRLKLSLHSTGGWVGGVGGRQELYYFSAKTFRIGQLTGTDLLLGASKVGLDPHGTFIDGILGSDFLSNYDVDLDLPEQKIRLFKVVAGCTTPAANLDQPLYSAALVKPDDETDKRPHVMVVIGGIKLIAVVDSGAQRSSIFRNSARRLGLRLADLTTDGHSKAIGLGPEARDEVGEITLSNLPVSIIDQRSDDDTDMLLGLDFLTRVHVWLSFHSHTMLMQYPPMASPKLADESKT
jgi:hypothetical protein